MLISGLNAIAVCHTGVLCQNNKAHHRAINTELQLQDSQFMAPNVEHNLQGIPSSGTSNRRGVFKSSDVTPGLAHSYTADNLLALRHSTPRTRAVPKTIFSAHAQPESHVTAYKITQQHFHVAQGVAWYLCDS